MTLKKKSWLSVALFILIFGGLLLTATVADLQVSKILTAHALEPGKYLSNDTFGVAFEAVGSTPVYMILAFAFQIMFWYILRNCKNKLLSALAGIFTLVASTSVGKVEHISLINVVSTTLLVATDLTIVEIAVSYSVRALVLAFTTSDSFSFS